MTRTPQHGTQAITWLPLAMMLALASCALGQDRTTTTPSPVTASSPEPTEPVESAADSVPSAEPTGQRVAFPVEVFAAISEEPVSQEMAAELQAVLDEMAVGGGIAATVMTPDGTWSGAAGMADDVNGVEIHSQFGIASGTKAIIAAQVMQLVEAGELSLDAPANQYLPAGFAFDTNGATIRQLLSHRSGIPNWYSDAMEERMRAEPGQVWELEETLALVDPGRGPVDAFEYADTNYNLLGLVIEHARQRPLVEILREGVLRVEGTERLVYQPDEAPTDPMAMPSGESRDALEAGGGYLPSISDATSAGPAGAVASDSVSLARWWRAFCAGDIVSQDSLTEMSTFYDGEMEYGLGLFNPAERASIEAVGHLGANFGYKSSAGCVTEAPLIFVVLTNQDLDSFTLATPLLRAVLSD